MKQLSEISNEDIKEVGKILTYGDCDFSEYVITPENKGEYIGDTFTRHNDRIDFTPPISIGGTFSLRFNGAIEWDYDEAIAGSLIILKAYDYLRSKGYEIITSHS